VLDTLRILMQIYRLTDLPRRRPEDILALQQTRLRRLLRYAQEHSPFYRQRFRGIDLRHCRLGDLPPLSKADLMANFDALVTDRRVRLADVERFLADPGSLGRAYLNRYAVCHTSGSQGQPAVIVQERLDMLRPFAAQVARSHLHLRGWEWTHLCRRLRRPARMAVVTQRPGFYPSGAVFTALAAARLPFLRLAHLSVFDPIADTVARLNGFGPNFLTGYTSVLEALAREQRQGHLRLRQGGCLEQVTNISEPLPPAARTLIEEAFGVRVADHYAMGECLALTSGCPLYPGAHLNADLACLEVVDDRYRPVPDGVPGSKVLVTNLYNRVQPLIRYQVGDVVTMSPSPCPCGSNLPLIQSIAGRTKERFWLAVNGAYRELPYYVFLAALHHCLEMAEHQVLQTGPNRFVLRVVPLPGKTVPVERLRKLVYDSVEAEGLSGLIDLDVLVVEDLLPDPSSGKKERVRNLIGPPPGDLRMEGTSSPVPTPLQPV
jgi:phenylacetate-CoA ligase